MSRLPTNKKVNTPLGPNRWDSVEEINNRLRNGLVKYDDHPYFVDQIKSDYEDGVYRLVLRDPRRVPSPPSIRERGRIREPIGFDDDTGEPIFKGVKEEDKKHPYPNLTKKINSAHFENINEFPLGFVNCFKIGKYTLQHATYIERRVGRRMRQSVNSNNVSIYCVDSVFATPSGNRGFGYDFSSLCKTDGFFEMCKNVYPSYEEVISHLFEDTSMAISRNMALYKDEEGIITLIKGSKRIGIVRNSEILLLKDSHYEIENLREQTTGDSPLFPSSIEINLY